MKLLGGANVEQGSVFIGIKDGLQVYTNVLLKPYSNLTTISITIIIFFSPSCVALNTF